MHKFKQLTIKQVIQFTDRSTKQITKIKTMKYDKAEKYAVDNISGKIFVFFLSFFRNFRKILRLVDKLTLSKFL